MKRLRIRITSLILVIAALTICLTTSPKVLGGNAALKNSETQWKTYTVEGEEFSVKLPAPPTMSTYQEFLERTQANRTTRILGAYYDGVVYGIYTFDNPEPRQSLQAFIDEFEKRGLVIREIAPQGDLNLKGTPGKRYATSSPGPAGEIQFYAGSEHLYAFVAFAEQRSAIADIVEKRDNPNVSVATFFSSIKLGSRLSGEKVSDDSGLGPEANRSVVTSRISNDDEGNPVFSGKEVTRKAMVFLKPEPSYTEIARSNKVTGSVALEVVLTASGRVTNIRSISELPDGLTEMAIAAARKIKFLPAKKDGRTVSMRMQLVYNFNVR